MNTEKRNLNEKEASELEAKQPLEAGSIEISPDNPDTDTEPEMKPGSRTERHETQFPSSKQAEKGFMDKSIMTEPPAEENK